MTARQQLARLLPLALVVVLVMAGLRGVVPAPRWNGPLRADGVAIGLAVEVAFGVLLVITLRREAAARRAARDRRYSEADDEIAPAAALRFVLKWVLGAGMAAVAVVLITNLHLHFFIKPRAPVRPPAPPSHPRPSPPAARGGPPLHIPIGPILYSLLVLALVAAVVISIWWSARLRRPAAPGRIAGDVNAEDLREAVESGLAALAELDDARAAIIACYLAMESSLAERGAARGAADTPDELLARAEAAGVVRGTASRRLTALFYEARFSSHPLGSEQRDAARQALGEGPGTAGRGRWQEAIPELAIAGIAVAVTALAAGAVAGWPGVATVAIAAAALGLVTLRALVPRSAAQAVRLARDKQVTRTIAGYTQRRFIVSSSVETRAFYESDLRPVLEHLLAARLAEHHGVNLYTDPAAARAVFCRGRGDESLWSWIDPAQALPAPERDMQWHGIPRRTLARLVNRLEQL